MKEKLEKRKKMVDGTYAFLTKSKKYYCRLEPDIINWESITYYTLEGVKIPLAALTCLKCGDHIESKHCGDFRACSCGACFVDTDRWFPEIHRYGGDEKDYKKE